MSEKEKWDELNERLVNANSAQGTTDLTLAAIERRLARHERMLIGDPEEDREGLIESRNRQQTEINKFNALLMPDIHGHGGVVNDLNELRHNRSRSEKREGYFWHFVTTLFVNFSVLIGLIVKMYWADIRWYVMVKRHTYEAASVERDTKRAKALRAKKRAPKVVHEEASPDLPE